MEARRRLDLETLVLAVLGAVSIANALWMLVAPLAWYENVPAGVPDFGPYNVHFVRDIGGAFFTVGFALIYAAVRPRCRLPLVATAAVFSVLHAAIHVLDTGSGAVGSHHWLLDAPGVYLPAVVLIVIVIRAWRRSAVSWPGP